MKLWLDDWKDPEKSGCFGWVWVKTAAEAVASFQTGQVTEASLDYNLEDYTQSGYEVVIWLEEHPEFWPVDGVRTHSSNPACNVKMQKVIDRHYKKT